MASDRFCCFRVHTIGIFLGWLGAIASAIGIAVLGVILGDFDWFITKIITNAQGDIEAIKKGALIITVVAMILACVHLLASTLLVLGTLKNKHGLIIPWLINSGFEILLGVINIGFIIRIIIETNNKGIELGSVIAALIILCFQILAWLAIRKLYKTIQRGQDRVNEHLLPSEATAPSYTRL